MSKPTRLSNLMYIAGLGLIVLAITLQIMAWRSPGSDPGMGTVAGSASFFDNVFRQEDRQSESLLLEDSATGSRAINMIPDLGFIGPHDLLGFRNLSVPARADVLVIGDSATYGNNAVLWENWPMLMQQLLPPGTSVYSMATANWGAIQYLYAASRAPVFRPEILVVAFNSATDSLDSLAAALRSESWDLLLPGETREGVQVPLANYPPPDDQQWQAEFADGSRTTMLPGMRLIYNQPGRAVDLGYQLMASAARQIASIAGSQGIAVYFTIIPSKEMAYQGRVEQEQLAAPAAYQQAVMAEAERIAWLETQIRALGTAQFIDVAGPLSEAVRGAGRLFPESLDGHPVSAGYSVIARELVSALASELPAPPSGLVISQTGNDVAVPLFVRSGQYWLVNGDYRPLLAEFPSTQVQELNLESMVMMGRVTTDQVREILAGEQAATQ